METVMNILHVVSAVFIVGPMAILPMTALRAVKSGNGAQVAVLAKSTNVLSLLSLLVVVFGFGVMGLADEKFDLSVTTPWILWSIILYAVALGISLFLVVPAMKDAAEQLTSEAGSVDSASAPSRARYPKIAAGSGAASLLLIAVVVLMVWKP
ncbi:MAG: conjugal transfer protein TrbL [Cryobacterium sp.]|jgi:uncharacterized membrane protein|nr:conjugal transfer protein TrbL [Cryobacterium sp.]